LAGLAHQLAEQHLAASKASLANGGNGIVPLTDIEAVVDNMTDVGVTHELAFIGKYRDLQLLRQELIRLDDLHQQRTVARMKRSAPNAPAPTSTSSVTINPSTSLLLGGELKSMNGTAAAIDDEMDRHDDAEYRVKTSAVLRSSMEIIVRLLAFKVAPRRYWPRLLWDAVPLLERRTITPSTPSSTSTGSGVGVGIGVIAMSSSPEPIISVADTHRLMACLEEVTLSHHSHTYIADLTPHQIGVIRLALARNIARAVKDKEDSSNVYT
jgi:hypothetical protein